MAGLKKVITDNINFVRMECPTGNGSHKKEKLFAPRGGKKAGMVCWVQRRTKFLLPGGGTAGTMWIKVLWVPGYSKEGGNGSCWWQTVASHIQGG